LRDWGVRRFAVAPSDAIKLLEKQWRLPVRALAAVFSSNNVISRLSEAGQLRDHPRVVVCRLGYLALISTKVRAHLKTRAAAKFRDALDDDGGGNGDHGRRADADEKHSDGGSGSDAVRDDAVGGNSTIVEPLNGGHRPEWVK